MKRDKKFLDRFKSDETTVDQWANENGIKLVKRKKEKNNFWFFKRFIVPIAACLMLAIIIPVSIYLNNGNSSDLPVEAPSQSETPTQPEAPSQPEMPSQPEAPKFQWQDASLVIASIEEVFSFKDICLFNLDKFYENEQVINYDSAYCEYYEQDNVELSRIINQILLHFPEMTINGEQTENAFLVDYMALMYSNYEYLNIDSYDALENSVTVNGRDYQYSIFKGAAYIKCVVDGKQYNLKIEEVEGFNEINEVTLMAFLEVITG